MALTRDEQQDLSSKAALYRKHVAQDAVGGIGRMAAGMSDVLRGTVSASALIKQNNPAMSADEVAQRTRELLKDLADYNVARRKEIGLAGKERHETIRQQLKSVSDKRKWALEQEVLLDKARIGAQGGIESAEIGKLIGMINESDRKYEQGNFGPTQTPADSRSRLSEPTLKKLDTLLLAIEMQASDQKLDESTYLNLLDTNLKAVGTGEREHVINVLRAETSGGYSFTNLEDAVDSKKELENSKGGRALRRFTEGANIDQARRLKQYATWERSRDEAFDEATSRGVGINPSTLASLRAISDATPEELDARVDALLRDLPEDMRAPPGEVPLEEDAYTRRIYEELDALADPRNQWPGSRHEQIRRSTEKSPEYKKWAEEEYQGAYDPDEAWKKMIAQTKSGLIAAPRDAETMEAADAASGLGDAMARQYGATGAAEAGLAATLVPKTRGIPGLTSPTTTFEMDEAPDLGATYKAGRKRQLLKNLGRTGGFALPDSSAASAMMASRAAQETGRLRKSLAEVEEEGG